MSETGIVTSGMIVARRLRRNTKITSATSTIASTIVVKTALIDCSMNTDESYMSSSFMPSSVLLISSISLRTACESSSGFATACLITPIVTAVPPMKRVMTRSSRGATSTRPRSRMRTGIAAHLAHDDRLELLRRLQVREREHGELALVALDAPGGDLDVLAAQRVLHVLHREAIGRELGAVHPDAHRDAAARRRCARPRRPAASTGAAGCSARRSPRPRSALARRRYRDPEDGEGVGLDLRDHRFVDRLGQPCRERARPCRARRPRRNPGRARGGSAR